MNFNLRLSGVRVVPFNGTVSKAKGTEETEDNKFKPTPGPLPPVYQEQQWDGLKRPENDDDRKNDIDSDYKNIEDKRVRLNPLYGLSTNKKWTL